MGKKLVEDENKASDCEYSELRITKLHILAFKLIKRNVLVDKANVLETSRLWRKSSFKNSSQLSEVSLNCIEYCYCNANRSQSKQFDVIFD
jgi:3-isopropylmalate dehydrogenase